MDNYAMQFSDLFALSTMAMLIYGIYLWIRISGFIVNRYEKETNLLTTKFFSEHATFTRYLPAFLSYPMYSSHLLMCLWGWPVYKNRKMFSDINAPESVTQHFTRQEIRWVKGFGVNCLIFFGHISVYIILNSFWPETLNR